MPIGSILLTILIVMIPCGLAGRPLDRLRISPAAALFLTAAMLLGGLIAIEVAPQLAINLGGGLIPICMCAWMIATTSDPWEKVRALGGAALASVGVALVGRWFPAGEPTELNLFYLDASYLYAFVAGVVGYLSGRSHRAAFCAGLLGVVLGDPLRAAWFQGRPVTEVGGGALLGVGMVAGVVAVALAELVAEPREAPIGQSRGQAGE